jgi:hypothetical protein
MASAAVAEIGRVPAAQRRVAAGGLDRTQPALDLVKLGPHGADVGPQGTDLRGNRIIGLGDHGGLPSGGSGRIKAA